MDLRTPGTLPLWRHIIKPTRISKRFHPRARAHPTRNKKGNRREALPSKEALPATEALPAKEALPSKEALPAKKRFWGCGSASVTDPWRPNTLATYYKTHVGLRIACALQLVMCVAGPCFTFYVKKHWLQRTLLTPTWSFCNSTHMDLRTPGTLPLWEAHHITHMGLRISGALPRRRHITKPTWF